MCFPQVTNKLSTDFRKLYTSTDVLSNGRASDVNQVLHDIECLSTGSRFAYYYGLYILIKDSRFFN
jgi:hypothetical protein